MLHPSIPHLLFSFPPPIEGTARWIPHRCTRPILLRFSALCYLLAGETRQKRDFRPCPEILSIISPPPPVELCPFLTHAQLIGNPDLIPVGSALTVEAKEIYFDESSIDHRLFFPRLRRRFGSVSWAKLLKSPLPANQPPSVQPSFLSSPHC